VRTWAFAIAFALSALPRGASGQEHTPPVRLEVDPSPDEAACPSLQSLMGDVRRRMGRDPFAQEASRRLTVRYRRGSEGWGARITARDELREGRGVRELARRAATCAELLDAVGLAVALAIDPDAPLAPPSAPPAAPVCPAPLECPPPAPTAPPSPPVVIERRVEVPAPGVPASLSLRGGVGVGATPLAPALMVAFRSRHAGPWHAMAGALYTRVASADGGATGFGLTALFGGACWGTSGALRLDACAGVQAGALHSVVYELTPLAPGDRLWLGAFVEGALRWYALGPVFVEGALRAAVALYQQRYSVRGRAAVAFAPWPVALDATLGAGVDF
jgi:hypothetical protein